MKIRGNEITGLLAFLFHHDDSHFTETLDDPNKSGDLKGFVFTVQQEGDLSISRR